MSARRIDTDRFPSTPAQTRLTLSADSVRIRKNGIEFRTEKSIPTWAEMTVDLQSSRRTGKLHCTGVVVACNGDRHSGYVVSLLFTNLSRHSREVLTALSQSRLA